MDDAHQIMSAVKVNVFLVQLLSLEMKNLVELRRLPNRVNSLFDKKFLCSKNIQAVQLDLV
jgi:hypothetical protein